MVAEESRSQAPPYISFRSLGNMLDRFKSEGLPHRIDRSFWGHFLSGSAGAQMMVALRSLGLVDQSDSPTDLLERMSDEGASAEDRKRILGEVLKQRYPEVMVLDLSRASWGQLEEVFKEKYGLDGETRRKAMTFFINAAQYTDVPLSTHITKRVRTRIAAPKNGGRSGQRKLRQNGGTPAHNDGKKAEEDPPGQTGPSSGQSRAVQLRSGGTITLSYSVDLFALDETDRQFLLTLVDTMRQYRKEPLHSPAQAGTNEGDGASHDGPL